MNTTSRILLFTAVLLCAAPVARATDYSVYWDPNPADPDNILTNDCHTSVDWATLEAALGRSTVVPRATATTLPSTNAMTITMPTDYVTTVRPDFTVDNGKKLTFDSPHVLRQRDLTDDEVEVSKGYANYAFVPNIRGTLFTDAVGQYVSKKYGGWCFDNVRFTMDATDPDTVRFDLERGTMNFYDPNGTKLTSVYVWFLQGGWTELSANVGVHAGSTLKMPICYVYDSYGKTVFTIDGGADHYIHKYTVRVPNNPSKRREHTFRIAGDGTRVRFDTIHYGATCPSNHLYRLEILDGATVVLGSLYGVSRNSSAAVFQMDGAEVSVSATIGSANIHATNTTFRAVGKPIFLDCDLHARSVTFADYDSIDFKTGRCLDWEGCRLTPSGTINFFKEATGPTEGSFRSCVISNSTGDVFFNNLAAVDSRILVEDTVLVSANSLLLGHTKGSSDAMTVRGDSQIGAKSQLVLGEGGSARFTLEGGTVAAGDLYLQRASISAPTTNVYVQKDGATTLGTAYLCCASGNGSHCELVLSNGVMRANQITGGANCGARNPERDGVAIVRLHGGVLGAESANGDLVSLVSHLYVGSGAPVVSGDVDFTLSQSLEDEPGESGEIVFAGTGAKTLSGTATSVSRIVVREGTVRFAAGARAASTLVVEAGGAVEFAEDPSAIGFTGLELRGGTVRLADGQVLAVDGDVSVESARVSAVCALPSTTVLITATGSVSAPSRAAWALTRPIGFTGDATTLFDAVDEDGLVKLREIVRAVSCRIELDEGASNATEDVTMPAPYAVLEAATGAGAMLTMGGTVTGGAISKTGDGILRLANLALWPLEGGFYLRAGTFEYAGNGSDALFDRPFVIAAVAQTNAVSIRNESALTVTNIANLSGVLVKRGVGTLTIAPPSGSSVDLAPFSGSDGKASTMDPANPRDFGDISSADWVPPCGYATMGFNVIEGEVVFRGDSSTRIDASHSVILGAKASGTAARAGLVVDGCRCSLAGSTGRFIEMGFAMTDGKQSYRNPSLAITNGAEVTTDIFILGRSCGDPRVSGDVVVDRSTWTLGSLRPSYSWNSHGVFRFRNQARVYAGEMLPYGPFDICLDGESVLAKNASLDGITLEMHYNGSRVSVSNGSAVAFAKFDDRIRTGTSLTLDFAGGTWHTPSNWQTLRTNRHASWVINTLTDDGLTFPVEEGRTLYAAHAICGAGGVVKTGAGTLEFETAGEWENSMKTQDAKTDLADPQTVKFDGPIDVRGGSVRIWNAAGRTGGTYRTAEGASIDFDGAALGAATLAGGGSFANATVTGGTLGLNLTDDGSLEGSPTMTDVAFSGRTYVDFGRRASPEGTVTNLVVATFSGAAPDVANWRSRNTGRGTRATFRVDGNTVRADIGRRGLVIVLD